MMKAIAFLLACAVTPFLVSANFCFCSYEINPVCGSDGVTYSNPCHFWCSNLLRAKEQKLTMACEISCDDPACPFSKLKSSMKNLGLILGPHPLKK